VETSAPDLGEAMPELELRPKIRDFMASGVLPNEPPVITRAGRGAPRKDASAICVESDPSVSYFWPGGFVVRLHTSCDALRKRVRYEDA
jgi:hypothetical protein